MALKFLLIPIPLLSQYGITLSLSVPQILSYNSTPVLPYKYNKFGLALNSPNVLTL